MKLVGDGFVLLILGQAMVFLFLGLMMWLINATAWVVQRFAAQPVDANAENAPAETDDEPAVAAAVAVAVQQFRAAP